MIAGHGSVVGPEPRKLVGFDYNSIGRLSCLVDPQADGSTPFFGPGGVSASSVAASLRFGRPTPVERTWKSGVETAALQIDSSEFDCSSNPGEPLAPPAHFKDNGSYTMEDQ